MALNIGVGFDALQRWEVFGEGHFVVMVVNAIVTQATNPDALIQLRLRIRLLKTSAAVQLFGNQVMEGEFERSPTQRAFARTSSRHR